MLDAAARKAYEQLEMDLLLHVNDCRLDAFMELIEQINCQHALVSFNFQHDRDRLINALASMKNLRVSVDCKAEDAASCGYGLNLQLGGASCCLIWYDVELGAVRTGK